MARTRTLTAGLAVAALIVTAVPAGAAETTFAAEAGSAGLTLDIAGEDVLDVGLTGAAAVPGEGYAFVWPAAIGGEPVGEREAESDGPLVLDPADPADRCEVAIPAPLDDLVDAGVVCGHAAAEGSVPVAAAAGGVAELALLDVDSGELDALRELLATLPLDAVLEPVEQQLLAELETAFGDAKEECLAALAPLNVADVLAPVLGPIQDAAPEEIAPLLAQLEGLLLPEVVPTACDVLGDVAELILGGDLLRSITSGEILESLAGAEGLLDVILLETESLAIGEDDVVDAIAGPVDGGAISIEVDIPLLDEILGDLLAGVVAETLSGLQEALAPLGEAVDPLPVVGELVGPLLTSGTIGDLTSGPLLSVGLLPGSAAASGDLETGETSGIASPALAELGGTLFSLPILSGLDDALDATAGALDDTLLAALRESPLADVVAIELLPESVEDAEVGGLAGTEATSGTASVQVLGAAAEQAGGPLLDLEVAPAIAAVGIGVTSDTDDPVVPAGPDPVTPTPTSLPATGGGAAFLALAALGAAASLRRRR